MRNIKEKTYHIHNNTKNPDQLYPGQETSQIF